jgi:KipI family sensor histidine kinase inhibitor
LHKALASVDAADLGAGELVTLPVYYGLESGPELELIAERGGISVDDVIAIHQQQEYRVYAIGFAPGFAYLGEVDERIAAPRLATPRQKVPRGAVAIADRQTAVYPAVSPGGWNLIGLCPTRMFDPLSNPSMPVKVGDRIRFSAIDRDEFLAQGGEL